MNGPNSHHMAPTSAPPTNTTTGTTGTGRRRKHNQNQSNAPNGHSANGSGNGPTNHCSPASQTSSALNSPNPQITPSPGRLPGQMNAMQQPMQQQQPQQQHPPPPYSPATSSVGSMRLPPYASPGPPTPSSMDNQMMMSTMGPGPGSNLQPLSGNSPKCAPNMQSQPNMGMMNMNGPSSAPSPSSPAAKKKHMGSGNGCSILDMNSIESGFMSPGPLSGPPNQGPQSRPGEPQLMPVPSPQQIQYLHQFDDQELTIKRQRNLSARDADLISPELDFLPEFSSNSGGGQLCNSVGSNNGGPTGHPQQPTHNMPNAQQPPQNSAMNRFASPIDSHCNSPMMGGAPGTRFAAPQPPYQDNRMNPNFGPGGPGQSIMYGPGPGRPSSAGQPQMQPFGNNGPNQAPGPNQMLPNSMIPNDQNSVVSMPLQPPVNEPPMTSNHLQNLQKMTPPFDIGQPPKMSDSFSSGQPMSQMSHPGGPMGVPGQMNNAFEMHGPGPVPVNNPQMMHPQDLQMSNCASVNCPPMNCPPGNGPPAGMAMMQPPMSQPGGHPYPNSSMSPMGHCGQPANGFSCPPNLMGSQNGPMLPPSPANQQQSMLSNGGRSPGPLYNSANSGFPHSASPKLTCSPSPQQMMMGPNGSHSNRPMPPYVTAGAPHPMQNRPPFGPRPGCPPQVQMNPNPSGHPPPNAMMHGQPQVQRPGQFNQPNIQMNNAKPNTIQYMPNRPPNAMGQNAAPGNQMMNHNRPPNLDFLQRYTSPPMTQMEQQQKGGLPPPMGYGMGPNNGPGMPPMGPNQGPPMHMNQMQLNGPPNQQQPGMLQMNVRPPHMMQMDGFGNPNRGAPPPGVQMQPGPCGPPPSGAGPMMGKPMSGGPNELAYMNSPSVPGGNGNGGGPAGLGPMGPGPNGPINGPMNAGGPPQFQGGPPMPGGGPGSGHPPPGSAGYKPFYPSMNANQDANYAAQFQQFQQQLYATNTRQPQNQMGGPMNQMPMNQMPNNPMGQNGPFFGQQPK
jgi:hypothetical protein